MPIDILKIDDENTGNVYLEKAGMIIQLKELDSVYSNSTEIAVEEVEEMDENGFIDLVELNVEEEAEVVLYRNGNTNIIVQTASCTLTPSNFDTVLITKEAKNVSRALGNGYALEVKLLGKSKVALKKG